VADGVCGRRVLCAVKAAVMISFSIDTPFLGYRVESAIEVVITYSLSQFRAEPQQNPSKSRMLRPMLRERICASLSTATARCSLYLMHPAPAGQADGWPVMYSPSGDEKEDGLRYVIGCALRG